MLINDILEGKNILTLTQMSVSQLIVSADLTFPLEVSCKLILYGQPSVLTVLGALEGLHGCSVWAMSLSLTKICFTVCGVPSGIASMAETISLWLIVYANEVIHAPIFWWVYPQIVYPFDYWQSLCYIGYFKLIHEFLFLEGLPLHLGSLHCLITLNICRRSGEGDYFILAEKFGRYHQTLLWIVSKYEEMHMNRCSRHTSWVRTRNTYWWSKAISKNVLDRILVKVNQFSNDSDPFVL